MRQYLELLQRHNVEPNFWCSEEYAQRARWICRKTAEDFVVVEGMDGAWSIGHGFVLPPIHPFNGLQYRRVSLPIWADLADSFSHLTTGMRSDFLDLEYIFDPAKFLDMSGGGWAMYRKNSRKWAREFPHHFYAELKQADKSNTYHHPVSGPVSLEWHVAELVMTWLKTFPEGTVIHDDDVMMDYIDSGENRWGLWRQTPDGCRQLVGMNIWDENWKFINYRYCFSLNEEWLADYMRLLFYLHMAKEKPGKLVNDGGVLGRNGLEFYKDKMNPIRKRSVYSWKVL